MGNLLEKKRSRNLEYDDSSADHKRKKINDQHGFIYHPTIINFLCQKKKHARVDGLYHYVLWKENIKAAKMYRLELYKKSI